jgi:aspartate aminotransferase-like enzyme
LEIDVMLACSEISLGLPPGFGMIALDEHANFKALGNPGKRWYLN